MAHDGSGHVRSLGVARTGSVRVGSLGPHALSFFLEASFQWCAHGIDLRKVDFVCGLGGCLRHPARTSKLTMCDEDVDVCLLCEIRMLKDATCGLSLFPVVRRKLHFHGPLLLLGVCTAQGKRGYSLNIVHFVDADLGTLVESSPHPDKWICNSSQVPCGS
jgi:hypothetical protein